jgi:hypothetical protein
MIKKLLLTCTLAVALAGITALLSATPAEAKNCPRGSHLVICPTGSFCCPNNALCVCL